MPDGTYVNNVKSTYGYLFGAGLDFGKVFLDARYNAQFKTSTIPYTNLENTVADPTFRTATYGLVLGYRF